MIKQQVEKTLDSIRNHLFIQSAYAGHLNEQQVLRWIMCVVRESRSFPDIIQNMLAVTENPVVKRALQENLDDELVNGDMQHAHFMHYLELIQKVGLDKNAFLEYPKKTGIKLAVSLAYNISTSRNLPMALGYMLVNTGMTPITYDAVRVASKRFFPDLKTTFFDVHIEVDEQHVTTLYEAVAALPETDLNDVLEGVRIDERGMAVLLDEVYGAFDFCAPPTGFTIPAELKIA
ncbi:iron-containing redox enzyme family protein [Gynuella sunshinyii]|uniref:Iron-containing redox enzyme family protein n=1 Tax=Gynuella sunshinyii YC6258 TaxID=1445510 RepID=A0A0C5VS93_9GAMM|nr:iron-containing redox enzyme family protein [Gynuella sunshinyii]AJQ97542.1 hypothetical Protein YC6258_05514 [Gynuella sunshinyii YC6258]